jgi:hypothetical protein
MAVSGGDSGLELWCHCFLSTYSFQPCRIYRETLRSARVWFKYWYHDGTLDYQALLSKPEGAHRWNCSDRPPHNVSIEQNFDTDPYVLFLVAADKYWSRIANNSGICLLERANYGRIVSQWHAVPGWYWIAGLFWGEERRLGRNAESGCLVRETRRLFVKLDKDIWTKIILPVTISMLSMHILV